MLLSSLYKGTQQIDEIKQQYTDFQMLHSVNSKRVLKKGSMFIFTEGRSIQFIILVLILKRPSLPPNVVYELTLNEVGRLRVTVLP